MNLQCTVSLMRSGLHFDEISTLRFQCMALIDCHTSGLFIVQTQVSRFSELKQALDLRKQPSSHNSFHYANTITRYIYIWTKKQAMQKYHWCKRVTTIIIFKFFSGGPRFWQALENVYLDPDKPIPWDDISQWRGDSLVVMYPAADRRLGPQTIGFMVLG